MALWKKSESHPPVRPHQISHPGVASHPDPPSGVSHVGMAPQLEMCLQPRLSRPQGLHYGCGAVCCSIRTWHVWALLVHTTTALGPSQGFERVLVLCFFSFTADRSDCGSAIPSQGLPSPRGCSVCAGWYSQGLRLRAPAEQSCSFPPSTTCPTLLWVVRFGTFPYSVTGLPGQGAVRVRVL